MVNQRTPDDVRAALTALGLDVEIIYYEESTATAQQAADAIGTALGSIVKSLCFIVDEDPVVVLTAGDRLVDDRKLGALFAVSRKKVKIADAETTLYVTGYMPGGVPPIAHANSIPIIIDQTLSRFEIVYAAAGASYANFGIPYETLVDVTGGCVEDIVKEPVA
jgi:prolyl-tRNA editing enzyme YbaK/EbsC (Cys-tRNA(Pro) deacylase)